MNRRFFFAVLLTAVFLVPFFPLAPARADATFAVDERRVLTGMERSWLQGYTPEISHGRLTLVLPIISPVAEGAIHGEVLLDDERLSPFPLQDMTATARRPANGVWALRFSLDLHDDRRNGDYRSNLDRHILPYFGDRVMSSITVEDIDDFLDALSRKPCRGPKSYGKRPEDIPTLSSSTVKKCFTILTSGFETAKKWHYISEIPKVTAPTEKTVKRRAWDARRVYEVLDSIKEDELLHLAVHLAFVCSLRAGETAGIDLHTIDFRDGSLWITRQIQRVSDSAIGVLPKHEVLRIFPKQVLTSKSSMILKGPKTEDSHRKQYLTTPLLDELRGRLARIEENKAFFREEYRDYGLLICQTDGRPVDPKNLEKSFKEHQKRIGIPENERIDFQGLRKSGQMHKVRLSQNNYQLVAENAGQSPEVLMNHYNEALDYEKRALSRLVENSFYPHRETSGEAQDSADVSALMAQIQQNPELCRKLLQSLTLGAQQRA